MQVRIEQGVAKSGIALGLGPRDRRFESSHPDLTLEMLMKIIGIVGTRNRDSKQDLIKCIAAFKKIYKEGDKLVSGGCPKGGDRFCEIIAKKMGLTITIHYPNWDKYGKPAGFIRNTLIAEDCDILIAVVASDRKGGTEDTIKKVKKLDKEVVLVY